MKFQHILTPNRSGELFEAFELVGTGLAIYRDHNPWWKRDEYYLIHIASGSRLISDFVGSFVSACVWIRRIQTLTDWTQSEESLQDRHDLEAKVRAARLDKLVGQEKGNTP